MIGCTVLAACTFKSPCAYSEVLPIRAGLWSVSITEDGEGTETSETCLDKNSVNELMQGGAKALGDACTGIDFKKDGKGFFSSTQCSLGISTISTSTRYQGDFSSDFTFTNSTTFKPPLMGRSSSSGKGHAVYKGACPAGMQPGDIKLSDGKVMNPKKIMENVPPELMKQMGEMLKKLPVQNP
jgi:hypothetical protein